MWSVLWSCGHVVSLLFRISIFLIVFLPNLLLGHTWQYWCYPSVKQNTQGSHCGQSSIQDQYFPYCVFAKFIVVGAHLTILMLSFCKTDHPRFLLWSVFYSFVHAHIHRHNLYTQKWFWWKPQTEVFDQCMGKCPSLCSLPVSVQLVLGGWATSF